MTVTADTITDEQLRQLRDDPGSDGDPDFIVALCVRALNYSEPDVVRVARLTVYEMTHITGYNGNEPAFVLAEEVIASHDARVWRARERCAAIWNARYRH